MIKHNRKYLDDLNIPLTARPENFCSDDDVRATHWKKQRDVYGFDERETWGLDSNFYMWLYERLSMYNEVNIVDTSLPTFEYRWETLTFQECIDRMLEGLKLELTKEYNSNELSKEDEDKINNILPIFTMCHRDLWW